MKSPNKGITLIALIITIIILLIFAGVTINVLIGDNGLLKTTKTVGENYQIAEIREIIEAEILALDIEKVSKGEVLTKEQALVEINKKGKFEEIDLAEDTGTIRGYIITLGYNENGKVVIDGIERNTGIKIITNITPTGYTKENVEIELGIKPNEIDITSIEVSEGMIEKENRKYEVIKNGTYAIKVILENGEILEKEIKIEQIDKLPPKSFTITAENAETGFIINGETEDEIATNENACSGIDRYEYIVKDANGKETTYNNNDITGIEPGKYQVYAIAYDKVGNPSKKDNEITVKYNFYEWNKYDAKPYYEEYLKSSGNNTELRGKLYFNFTYSTLNFNEWTGEFYQGRNGNEFYGEQLYNPNGIIGIQVAFSKYANEIYYTKTSAIFSTDSCKLLNYEVWGRRKSGEYYKDSTSKKGIVASTNKEEYPINGYKDGYWYEIIK